MSEHYTLELVRWPDGTVVLHYESANENDPRDFVLNENGSVDENIVDYDANEDIIETRIPVNLARELREIRIELEKAGRVDDEL